MNEEDVGQHAVEDESSPWGAVIFIIILLGLIGAAIHLIPKIVDRFGQQEPAEQIAEPSDQSRQLEEINNQLEDIRSRLQTINYNQKIMWHHMTNNFLPGNADNNDKPKNQQP